MNKIAEISWANFYKRTIILQRFAFLAFYILKFLDARCKGLHPFILKVHPFPWCRQFCPKQACSYLENYQNPAEKSRTLANFNLPHNVGRNFWLQPIEKFTSESRAWQKWKVGIPPYKEARKHINFHASKLVETRQKSEVDAIFKTIPKVVSGK